MSENSEENKRPVGRPLKFETLEELELKISEYFGMCDPHIAKRKVMRERADGTHFVAEEECITDQIPYTVTGLALFLDTSRQTLINYEERPEFFDAIARAKLKCEQFAEQHLYTGKTPAGAVFTLKNNFGWKDESTVNNPQAVVADLNALERLDEQKKEMSEEAAKELKDGAPGSAPK